MISYVKKTGVEQKSGKLNFLDKREFNMKKPIRRFSDIGTHIAKPVASKRSLIRQGGISEPTRKRSPNHQDNTRDQSGIVGAYGTWVEELLTKGYEAYLLTFMFHALRGSAISVDAQMRSVVERTYATSLTRLYRHPCTGPG